MVKIYESPDGGKTVYERESGETDRILVSDYEDDVWDMTEANTLSVNSSSITSSSITGSTYAYNGYPYNSSGNVAISNHSNHHADITFQDENGKQYSFRQMYKSLEAIEKRLTILVPDDKLLKKYEILQDLYDQYKAAEALLYDNEDE